MRLRDSSLQCPSSSLVSESGFNFRINGPQNADSSKVMAGRGFQNLFLFSGIRGLLPVPFGGAAKELEGPV